MAYHYDANNIPNTPPKKRTGSCIMNGIKKSMTNLRNRGLTPKIHIMDNKISEYLKWNFDKS